MIGRGEEGYVRHNKMDPIVRINVGLHYSMLEKALPKGALWAQNITQFHASEKQIGIN